MIQNTVDLSFVFKKKQKKTVEEPQTLVPFSDSFCTLILHSRLFKQIFFKAFPFFKRNFLRRKECFLNCMGAIVFLMF